MGKTPYPCVPGHELAGICIEVGSEVTRIKVGMQLGVGCLVDSCLACDKCAMGEEQKCSKNVGTYGSTDNGSGRAHNPIGWTVGGYEEPTDCRACALPAPNPRQPATRAAAKLCGEPSSRVGVAPLLPPALR